jgi:hypothetical protein
MYNRVMFFVLIRAIWNEVVLAFLLTFGLNKTRQGWFADRHLRLGGIIGMVCFAAGFYILGANAFEANQFYVAFGLACACNLLWFTIAAISRARSL